MPAAGESAKNLATTHTSQHFRGQDQKARTPRTPNREPSSSLAWPKNVNWFMFIFVQHVDAALIAHRHIAVGGKRSRLSFCCQFCEGRASPTDKPKQKQPSHVNWTTFDGQNWNRICTKYPPSPPLENPCRNSIWGEFSALAAYLLVIISIKNIYIYMCICLP